VIIFVRQFSRQHSQPQGDGCRAATARLAPSYLEGQEQLRVVHTAALMDRRSGEKRAGAFLADGTLRWHRRHSGGRNRSQHLEDATGSTTETGMRRGFFRAPRESPGDFPVAPQRPLGTRQQGFLRIGLI
jgi:hypothetical protein